MRDQRNIFVVKNSKKEVSNYFLSKEFKTFYILLFMRFVFYLYEKYFGIIINMPVKSLSNSFWLKFLFTVK